MKKVLWIVSLLLLGCQDEMDLADNEKVPPLPVIQADAEIRIRDATLNCDLNNEHSVCHLADVSDKDSTVN